VRGRSGRSWEDDIKMNPKEMEWQGVEWFNVSQDMDKRWAVVITVMNNRITGNNNNNNIYSTAIGSEPGGRGL
jgi:hypothetical protein